MIDLHCHLLPFLDDGAEDWDASLAIARASVADGVTEIVATPHWFDAPEATARLRERLEELRGRLAAAEIPLRVHSGNEVVLVPRLVEALEQDAALTLAGSNYLLLETAQLETGAYIHEALFQLQSHGYRIILAHPERRRGWQQDLEEMRPLAERGCTLQVNAGSLLGEFGRGARRAAEQLLRDGWVSLLATDAHSPTGRRPRLAEARRRAAELIGEEAAAALVEANPARVLRNEQLPHVNPAEPSRARRFFFLR